MYACLLIAVLAGPLDENRPPMGPEIYRPPRTWRDLQTKLSISKRSRAIAQNSLSTLTDAQVDRLVADFPRAMSNAEITQIEDAYLVLGACGPKAAPLVCGRLKAAIATGDDPEIRLACRALMEIGSDSPLVVRTLNSLPKKYADLKKEVLREVRRAATTRRGIEAEDARREARGGKSNAVRTEP